VSQKIEINDWRSLLEVNAADADSTSVKALLDGTNGFTYLFNFYFSSDFYIIFTIVCLLFIGIVFGQNDYCRREGMGNFILARTDYKSYMKKTVVARALYMISCVSVFEIITCLITLLLCPVKKCEAYNFSLNLSTHSMPQCLMLLLLNLLILLSFLFLTMIFSFIINVKCNNKYMMMFVPFCVYMIPFILCSAMNYIMPMVSLLIEFCVSDRYLLLVEECYKTQRFAVDDLSIPLILVIASAVLIKYMSGGLKNFLNSR
jgi:hypothetical protein